MYNPLTGVYTVYLFTRGYKAPNSSGPTKKQQGFGVGGCLASGLAGHRVQGLQDLSDVRALGFGDYRVYGLGFRV